MKVQNTGPKYFLLIPKLSIGLKVLFKIHFYFIVKANFILKLSQTYNEIS